MRLPSAKDVLLARLNIARKRMHWYTIAILIWLTFYEMIWLFFAGEMAGINSVSYLIWAVQSKTLDLQALGGSLSNTIVNILWALAIVGIIMRYFRDETSSRLRWGPLCGIAGAAVMFVGLVVSVVVYGPMPSPGESSLQAAILTVIITYFYGPVAFGIPSYVEYLIEGPPAKTERVTRAVLSQRLSSALTWYVEELDVTIDQMRKRLGRDLTLLTMALPLVFWVPIVLPALSMILFSMILYVPNLVLSAIWFFSAVFFLILAVRFSPMLRRSRDAILALNHPDHFAAVATAERNGLIKEARPRLAIFLLIFAFPVLWWPIISVGNPQDLPLDVSFAVLVLSALACFLLGYRALTQSSVAAKALETPALKGLLQPSVCLLPVKVRAGEAHSVLINFNLAGKGTTSFVRGLPVFDQGHQPYYEANLQAAGATIDDEKRRAIFEGPCMNEDVWSISFPNRGTQALQLLLNAVHARSNSHEADRETLFAYVHNVLVEGWLTGSDNAISIVGVIVTAAGVLASALPFVVQYVLKP
jgi:hypothetical protein